MRSERARSTDQNCKKTEEEFSSKKVKEEKIRSNKNAKEGGSLLE